LNPPLTKDIQLFAVKVDQGIVAAEYRSTVYSKAAPRRCFLRLTDIATGKIRRTAQYQYSVKTGGGPVAYQDDVLWIGLMSLGAAMCFYGGVRRSKWFFLPNCAAVIVTAGVLVAVYRGG
jgi:hypothetical protein